MVVGVKIGKVPRIDIVAGRCTYPAKLCRPKSKPDRSVNVEQKQTYVVPLLPVM